jgi:hypothetical protein
MGDQSRRALVASAACRHSLEKRAVTNIVKGIIGKRPSRDIWPRLELIVAWHAWVTALLRAREIRETPREHLSIPRRNALFESMAARFNLARVNAAVPTRGKSSRALAPPPFGRFVRSRIPRGQSR